MYFNISIDPFMTKYLVYMAEENQYFIQIEQQIVLTEAFEQKIKNFNRQELLFVKASLIAYKNIEKNGTTQPLASQYILLINKQLQDLSNIL